MARQDAAPFTVAVPDEVIADLQERLRRTRWTDTVAEGWQYGSDITYLKELCDYWADSFDWRKQEARLNQLDHFRTEIDGIGIHFLHQRSANPDATALVLLHGWPSSFLQMLPILPLLEDFHVVVPSLLGFGFSDRPTESGVNLTSMGAPFATLMRDVLGYDRYVIRASDLGAGVATGMAMSDPEAVIGLHMNGSNPATSFDDLPDDLSQAERQMIEDVKKFQQEEFAYFKVQSTKPQSLAVGLNDSPAGQAAWIIEKFRAWSDCDGDVENAFTRDDLLTNLTVYWATETIGSSMRVYYENAHTPAEWGALQAPMAVTTLPYDLYSTPRAWVERSGPLARLTELPRGGHFAEWEVPELIAADLRAFARGLNLLV
ncbi:epoxide hydrolase family protein [Streptomyces sp. cg28]|uniref:epoxide hydrolase family protein n=1 Tax=Streptomyces sp. cg28 TaxID=3403457 RepID=UPI003B21E638